MIKCKHCEKVIEVGKQYITLNYIEDYCNADCALAQAILKISDAKQNVVEKVCEHCFNCKETAEHSMFGTMDRRKCKLDDTVDCDDMEDCKTFVYGEPEKYDFTYNSRGGHEETESAIKYEKETSSS